MPMEQREKGYYEARVKEAGPGGRYFYLLDGSKRRPDPASRLQPEGVHGPSQVVGSHFPWEDQDWSGLPLKDYILYELHVGLFTPQGSFDAIIPRLDELKDLGITALELMPVAQFPGSRNWGYDGVYPFAVQNSYGGPEGLKRLVAACHRRGMAVVLDVVYNHLGPEGNYLGDFGPYFTDRYRTPWGQAVNFDGPYSDEVRSYYIANALYWIREFHIDALRLDAVHAILDHSPRTFLEELGEEVHAEARNLKRRIFLIPESADNNSRLVRARELGGYGLDAVWNDDFHHSLRVMLTGDRTGYYQDYGELGQMVKTFREGFAYSGEYSAYRKRRHGSSSRDIPAERFVVFAQNHDQVGNRMLGERLSQLVSFEGLKLAAGVVLLSPFVPLIFMGEEYGESAPFQYFISHLDPALVEAVRKGRREEFAAFGWKEAPPDPQDRATFERSRPNPQLRREGDHAVLFELYKELIRLRKETPALAHLSKEYLEVAGFAAERILFVRRWRADNEVFMLFNLGERRAGAALPIKEGRWLKLLDSAQERWRGQGSPLPDELDAERQTPVALSPQAFALFIRKGKD